MKNTKKMPRNLEPYQTRLRKYEEEKNRIYCDPNLSAAARDIEIRNLTKKYKI